MSVTIAKEFIVSRECIDNGAVISNQISFGASSSGFFFGDTEGILQFDHLTCKLSQFLVFGKLVCFTENLGNFQNIADRDHPASLSLQRRH